jgi:hypothetical protein
MKYYKSKRGYFYKIIGDKKIRISIEEYKSMKGGTVESDGKIEISDFKKGNGQFTGIPRLQAKISLKQLRNVFLKVLRKPFFLLGEPVIFFGLNGGDFEYACYNIIEGFSKKIVFVYKNTKSVEINLIPIENLIELFWGLVNIRTKDKTFMNTLYDTLRTYFSIHNQKLKHVVDDDVIRQMTLSYNTGRKNSNSKRKSLSVFNLTESKKIMDSIPQHIQKILIEKLQLIMTKAEIMRTQGISPTDIDAYKSNKFQKIVNSLLIQTQRRTI